jgi:type II secretory pathway component PulF
MIESIKHGSLLSGAMATQPQVFDNVFVGLVAVGEKSGQLANIFHHLSEHLKWNEDNRKRIAAASYYPIFLSMLLCSVVAIMMIFVIPKLTTFLQSQNIPMPFYTSALIATSDFIATNWQAMLATISGFYVTLRLAVNYSIQIITTCDWEFN